MYNKYKIIALIGEAGSGKDSLLRETLNLNPNFHEIISYTTRPKRDGEVDGINYFFISPEKFGEKVLNQEMIEASCFNNWFYGTGYEALRHEVINIGVFNPEGIEAFSLRKDIDLLTFYISTSTKERIRRQLYREENPEFEEIYRRYKADQEDFYDLGFPHKVLINEIPSDLSKNAEVLSSITDKDF